MIPSITPAELLDELMGESPPTVIDVREDHELAISYLAGAIHIPLALLNGNLSGLNRDAKYVMLCRVGGRSAHATQYLLEQGFANVRNLSGGINEWARTIDPSLRQY